MRTKSEQEYINRLNKRTEIISGVAIVVSVTAIVINLIK